MTVINRIVRPISGMNSSTSGRRIAALALITAALAGAQTTYTISGTVFNSVNGAPVPGITVNLTGGQTRSTTTNSAGQYAFTALPANLTYTFVPSGLGYQFAPFAGIVTLIRDLTAHFSATPDLGLDRLQIRFGSTTSGGFVTSPQEIQVRLNALPSSAQWTATPSHPWIIVSPTSGTGDGKFTVSINPNSLPGLGAFSGTVTVTVPNAVHSPQTLAVGLNVIGAGNTAAPIGVVDTPANGTANLSGAIGVTGWALDDIEVILAEPGRPVRSGITLWRNRIGNEPTAPNGLVYVVDGVFLDGARPDVAAAFPNYPLNTRGGWGVQVLTNMLPNSNGSPGTGNGTYQFSVFAHDREGKSTLIGSPTVTVNNAAATKPFGTLDTPANGETISGVYTVFGWAVTPQPATIPTNGSTIIVFVDGMSRGPVTSYGHERADIEMLFPGYNNTIGPNGAIGYYYLDTTQLSNGLHSIAWSVTDNLGRVEGIGNRLFRVQN